MTPLKLVTATVICVAGWSAAVEASVLVSFTQPERYRDAARDGGRASAREPVLREIAQYLETLGARRLSPSQTLKIEVLDIDLAGEINPLQALNPRTRVLRADTWPRIRLRYSLEEGGGVRASGEESITDQDYQAHAPVGSTDALRYEKAMLDDWFTRRFAPARR